MSDDKKNKSDETEFSKSNLFRSMSNIDPALLLLEKLSLGSIIDHFSGVAPEPVHREPSEPRWQDNLIEKEVITGSSVLDLGCGDGVLLKRLILNKQVRGQGVELDPEAVFNCVERGVPVFQADLDVGLEGFPDGAFDFVILEETLQTLHKPAAILQEMLRVGRRGIVSFPNYGNWRVRLDLSLRGSMPMTNNLPHPWYDSPNLRLFTIRDFLEWTNNNGVKVVQAYVMVDETVREMADGDNLYAEEALLIVEKQND